MSTENGVIVLFDGYSEDGADGVMNANCTSTLIRGKETLTIVDTRTAWDGDALVAGNSNSLSSPIETVLMSRALSFRRISQAFRPAGGYNACRLHARAQRSHRLQLSLSQCKSAHCWPIDIQSMRISVALIRIQ